MSTKQDKASVQFTIRLPAHVKKVLEERAEKNCRSLSKEIAFLVREKVPFDRLDLAL